MSRVQSPSPTPKPLEFLCVLCVVTRVAPQLNSIEVQTAACSRKEGCPPIVVPRFRSSRFVHGGVGIYFYRLCRGPHRQLHSHTPRLIDAHSDSLLYKFLEALCVGLQAIVAEGKSHEEEVDKRIGHDRRVSDYATTRVDHPAANACCGLLRFAPWGSAKTAPAIEKPAYSSSRSR
jgi:hypothetical protein